MFGTLRIMAHFVALLATLCLVVATAAAQAQTTAFTPVITPIGLNAVKVSFTTPTPTTPSVSTSTDMSFALTVLDIRPKRIHNITIPENPGTTYNIMVVATPAKGKPSVFVDSFSTGAIGSVPATLTTVNGKTYLNGVRYFPIVPMGRHCLDQAFVDANLSMGIKLMPDPLTDLNECTKAATSPGELDDLLRGRAWVYGTSADSAQAIQGASAILDWQAKFRLLQEPGSLQGCSEYFASSAPLFAAVKIEVKKGPTMYWVVLVNQTVPSSKPLCLDGPGMRNVFWTSIIGGVQGLQYFTFMPVTGEMNVKDDVAKAAGAAASCMTNIGPVILNGKPLAVAIDPKSPVKLGAWRYGGVAYIVAVNTEKSLTSASFSVPGLGGIVAQTLCEPSRTLKLNRDSITDKFVPVDVHIYKVMPVKK